MNANLQIKYSNIKARMNPGDHSSQFSDFLSGKLNIQKGLESVWKQINSPQPIRNRHKSIRELLKVNFPTNFFKTRNHIWKFYKSFIHAGANTQEIKGKCLYFENISAVWKWEKLFPRQKGGILSSRELIRTSEGNYNIYRDFHRGWRPLSSICGHTLKM